MDAVAPVLLADADGCLPLLDDGQSINALSNYYSSLFGAAGALPKNMPLCLPRRAMINLQPMDSAAAEFQQLKHELAASGYWVDDYFCFGNWYLDVAGRSFNDYLSSRSSQLRSNIQRGKGKLAKAGNWQIVIHRHLGAELEQAIFAFEAVYALSWKNPEPHPDFIANMCRMAATQGWLRLGVLALNDKPVAAQIWLTYQGVANIYKLAYDEGAMRYSAGSVLTAAMMEHALDNDQVHEVDYLTGDEPYKQDWMSHRRERRGIIAFDLTQWHGLLAAARHWAGRCWHRIRSLQAPS
jgi:hypothetical protein